MALILLQYYLIKTLYAQVYHFVVTFGHHCRLSSHLICSDLRMFVLFYFFTFYIYVLRVFIVYSCCWRSVFFGFFFFISFKKTNCHGQFKRMNIVRKPKTPTQFSSVTCFERFLYLSLQIHKCVYFAFSYFLSFFFFCLFVFFKIKCNTNFTLCLWINDDIFILLSNI